MTFLFPSPSRRPLLVFADLGNGYSGLRMNDLSSSIAMPPIAPLQLRSQPMRVGFQPLVEGLRKCPVLHHRIRVIGDDILSATWTDQEAAQFLPKGCSRKMPPSFLNLNGGVCSNTLFSNTSALTSSLLFRGNPTCKILEHLVWSNTSGFQFWGPLARTLFLSVLCGLPNRAHNIQ